MILVTRLNGDTFALNADLIERVDVTPDTVLSLVDGRKYVVAESAQEVIDKVVAFRAAVLVMAEHYHEEPAQASRVLHLVPDTAQEV
jgi:flagellar protein FlbD